MKLRIFIKLKEGVLDVQGKAIERSLNDIGYPMATQIRVGKFVDIDFADKSEEQSLTLAAEICQKLLVNNVIESYEISKLIKE